MIGYSGRGEGGRLGQCDIFVYFYFLLIMINMKRNKNDACVNSAFILISIELLDEMYSQTVEGFFIYSGASIQCKFWGFT